MLVILVMASRPKKPGITTETLVRKGLCHTVFLYLCRFNEFIVVIKPLLFDNFFSCFCSKVRLHLTLESRHFTHFL